MKAQDAANGPKHVLKEVRTLNSMLAEAPGGEARAAGAHPQQDRQAPRACCRATSRSEADAWRPPDYLRPLDRRRSAAADPRGVHRDRRAARAAHRHRRRSRHLLRLERARPACACAEALQVDALGKHWVAASTATIFAGMLETIIADGPRVTLGRAHRRDLAGPARVRPARRAARAGGARASASSGSAASSAPSRLKLNFMNFVALPITLGVGADYAANIWARLRAEGSSRIKTRHRRHRHGGRAVLADDHHRLQLAAPVAQPRAALVRPARRPRRDRLSRSSARRIASSRKSVCKAQLSTAGRSARSRSRLEEWAAAGRPRSGGPSGRRNPSQSPLRGVLLQRAR